MEATGTPLDAAAKLVGCAAEVEATGRPLDAAASWLGCAADAASLVGCAAEVEAAAVDVVDGPGVGFKNFNSASEERSM